MAMMRKTLAATLAGLAGLALAGSAALAQDTSSLQVTPQDSVTTTPTAPARGFDTPAPALTLTAPPDPTALRGLKPGQDLVGQDKSHTGSLPAAVTDSYFNSQEYQQKAETIERKGHQSAAKQFAGAGEAAAANLAIGGVGLLINGN
jgi:hypothetical protein